MDTPVPLSLSIFRCWVCILGCFALGIRVGLAQPTSVRPESTANYNLIAEKIWQESIANSQAYNNLKELTQIGHRLSGTTNGQKAEEFMLLKAKGYGLKPLRYQPFPIQVWQRQFLELDVVPQNSDHFVSYEAVALANTPREADIRAKIIDAGNGLREDFERIKDSIQGKVVLLNIGFEGNKASKKNLHRSEKMALVEEYHGLGAIFINAAPGRTLLTGTCSVDGNLVSSPAVCIGQDAGKALRKWASEEKLLAQIRMENTFDLREARNVIGTIKGKGKPNEVIVVGAHLDCWDLATGAIDNGLGSAIILEAARLLKAAGVEPERTIQFVWFMGEEQGLVGSQAFIKKAKERNQLNKIKYMINFDMAGNAMGWNTEGFSKSDDFFSQVTAQMAVFDTAVKNNATSSSDLHSDHQPFLLQGIPVAQTKGEMPASVYNCYHADCDRINLVEPFYLDRTARLAALMAYALATEKELPSQRLTEEQTKALLIKAGLKEELILGKTWPFKD